MKLPKTLTTVTAFSKLLAGILFFAFIVAAFFAGMKYQAMIDSARSFDSTDQNKKQAVCTQEAKLCPDGKTYVGRQGSNCEFAPCP